MLTFFYTCFQEMLGWNRGRDALNPDHSSSWFSLVSPGEFREGPFAPGRYSWIIISYII
jgi:hypothetical protein